MNEPLTKKRNLVSSDSRLRQAKEVFIGTRDCGCVVAISIDYDRTTFFEWEAEGYKISTTTLDDAKNQLKECTHK